MECPRCGLDNMPGSVLCFQCKADLKTPGPPSADAFYPPRAPERGLAQGLERRRPPAIGRARPFGSGLSFATDLVTTGLLAVIPGFGQRRNGEPLKGAWLFIIAGLLVLLNLAGLRHRASPVLMWLLVGVVGYSMLDAVLVVVSRWTERSIRDQAPVVAGTALLGVTAFLLLCYASVVMATNLVFLRIVIPVEIPGFSAGEVALAPRSRGFTPARGDLVVVQATDPGGAIEVVLGLPGEEVSAEQGVLRVGGRVVDAVASAGLKIQDMRLVVPGDSYFCLQYTFVRRGRPVALTRFVTTNRSTIQGKPLAVISPPEKRRFLR